MGDAVRASTAGRGSRPDTSVISAGSGSGIGSSSSPQRPRGVCGVGGAGSRGSWSPVGHEHPYGTSFGAFGNHDFCRGTQYFGLSALANRPGFVRIMPSRPGSPVRERAGNEIRGAVFYSSNPVWGVQVSAKP